MEVRRFRNHILTLAEQFLALMKSFVPAFIIFIITIVQQIRKEETEGMFQFAVFMAAMVGIFLLRFVFSGIRWWKTWYIFDENAVTEERVTIFYKKNSMAIANISNVNLEQTLFERIFGMKKVKINTNSSTTANETDITILVKAKDAEWMKNYLELRMKGEEYREEQIEGQTEGPIEEQIEGQTEEQTEGPIEGQTEGPIEEQPAEPAQKSPKLQIKSSHREILLHTIYSLNVAKLMVAISTIVLGAAWLAEIIEGLLDLDLLENLSNTVAESISLKVYILPILVLAFLPVLIGIGYQMVKTYLMFFGFTASRSKDKISIRYGLLKNNEYAIPVSAISSVVIHQTLIARLCHKYSAELINIGMGDEQEESAFLCFYMSREELNKNLQTLLPEFSDVNVFDIPKQPKEMLGCLAFQKLVEASVLILLGAAVIHFTEVPVLWMSCGCAVFWVFGWIGEILSYQITGISAGKHFLAVRTGRFGTKTHVMSYDRIQRFEFNSNPISRIFGLQKGTGHILASTLKSYVLLPYLDKTMPDVLGEKIIRPVSGCELPENSN